MRVLHVTLSFEPGGRREAIRTLAKQQHALGVESDLCCVGHLGCDEGLATAEFGRLLVLARRGLFDRAAIRRLGEFCDERAIEVIHVHDAASQALAACVRLWRPRIKLLMTFHRSLGFESARRIDRLRNAMATMACGAVVCGSRERRSHFLAENWVSARKVVRIPFGIDLARFGPDRSARKAIRDDLGIDDDTFVFGAAGHFGQEKGIDRVVRAFGRLSRELPPDAAVRLIVLGAGKPGEQEGIETLAAEQRAGGITLAGFHRDVERWFNAMDVFVHLPRQEAFGLVLVEAMATRLPIVASAVGGIPDLVRPGVNGLLVDGEDAAGTAAAMRQLHDGRDLRERLSAGAMTVANTEYASHRYAADYLRLYEDLLGGRPPRGVDEWAVETDSTVRIVSRDRESAAMIS